MPRAKCVEHVETVCDVGGDGGGRRLRKLLGAQRICVCHGSNELIIQLDWGVEIVITHAYEQISPRGGCCVLHIKERAGGRSRRLLSM